MCRVMVISAGGPSLAIRLKAYLDLLRAAGGIEGYTVFDHQGLPQGPDRFPAYDAVVVHRSLPRTLHPVLAGRRIPFIFDADDIAVPALARSGGDAPRGTPLRETLYLAGAVMSPSRRLPEVAAWHNYLPAPKAYFVPYAFPGGDGPRPGPAQGVVFAGWNGSLLDHSRQAVLSAIEDFAAGHGVPVFNCSREKGLFRAERHLGALEGWAFESQLRSLPPVIAAVPVETVGGPFLEDALSCRSDVEKALFGSLGVAAVFSAARPFTESDLATGTTVANDREAWLAGLQLAWEHVGDAGFANREAVLAQRAPDKVARECLLPALLEWSRPGQIGALDLVAAGR